MFHKEGHRIIINTFLIVAVFALAAEYLIPIFWLKMGVQISALLIFLLVLQFFRNPKRITPQNDKQLIAPVDGKVVIIEEVYEKEYFKDKRLQVSIFMSPLNVHVTRYTMSGQIKFSKYHPGKYLVAWHPKSSELNERFTSVYSTHTGQKILVRQIAGALARRIVNYLEDGKEVSQGEEMGFIKFGSRADIFLPLDANIKVEMGQHVKSPLDIIAEL